MKEEKEVAGGITHLSEMHFKICICVNKMKQYSSFLRFYHFDLPTWCSGKNVVYCPNHCNPSLLSFISQQEEIFGVFYAIVLSFLLADHFLNDQ